MTERPPALRKLIEAARAAYTEFAIDPAAKVSVSRIFAALDGGVGDLKGDKSKLPVCSYLDDALRVRLPQRSLGALMDAFAELEPELGWRRRASYDLATASDNFHDGHGNCMIVGPGGYENRSDLGLGVSLLAPRVRYPDHDHPPEETYLVLSDGMFRQGDGTWFTPGVGGSFYNVPMIKHAMRSGEKPLFAFWALWMGQS
ncbi:dimethylsulfonioproprionate lyase family protein [Shinella zoogloeoides]|uniref:dimethylsulfonioproprionate lyase family protein n=1 Tax=Shinella zoogloeoides TaxID=352475 RepID=UPI001F574933|nr:dimethylsulfonioproprionate lyase family protein [Shinella zoogloeoides]